MKPYWILGAATGAAAGLLDPSTTAKNISKPKTDVALDFVTTGLVSASPTTSFDRTISAPTPSMSITSFNWGSASMATTANSTRVLNGQPSSTYAFVNTSISSASVPSPAPVTVQTASPASRVGNASLITVVVANANKTLTTVVSSANKTLTSVVANANKTLTSVVASANKTSTTAVASASKTASAPTSKIT